MCCQLYIPTPGWTFNFWILGKTFCWFSSEVFELQISPIPIFASSFQELSDGQINFSLQPTQQLTLDKTWFWAIYLTDTKTFLLLRNFEKNFRQLCSFRYLLWVIKRHFIISLVFNITEKIIVTNSSWLQKFQVKEIFTDALWLLLQVLQKVFSVNH